MFLVFALRAFIACSLPTFASAAIRGKFGGVVKQRNRLCLCLLRMFFTDAVILHAGEVADLGEHSVPSITADSSF